MANMQTYIEKFIAEHDLDEGITDPLIELVNKCFTDYVSHMSAEWLTAEIPTAKKTTKKAAATKAAKLEDASEAESLEELKRNCTSIVLNNYCREHKLRIGGNKDDIAERVWRHLQGEQTDDDISPRSKPKKVVAKKEQHQCFACNAKGQPCGVGATNEHEGEWFCFRHINDADDIIAAKAEAAKPKESKPKASPKAAKSSAAVSKRPGAFKKKAVVEEPEELEEEESEEEA